MACFNGPKKGYVIIQPLGQPTFGIKEAPLPELKMFFWQTPPPYGDMINVQPHILCFMLTV